MLQFIIVKNMKRFTNSEILILQVKNPTIRNYLIRQTILNNIGGQDIRAQPYMGFAMFARKWCGVDFFDALDKGEIKLAMYDFDATYKVRKKTPCLILKSFNPNS